jgi:hypothetical protein
MNRHLASAILQCGIDESHDLMRTVNKCVLVVTGDQNGVQDACEDIGHGARSMLGAGAMIASRGDAFPYDIVQFVDNAFPVSNGGVGFGPDGHQDHFEEVRVLLDVLQMAV